MSENKRVKAFSYALDLDEKVRKDRGTGLNEGQFSRLARILDYPQTVNGQKKFFICLNNLSTEDLFERIRQVSTLLDLLVNIQKNKR